MRFATTKPTVKNYLSDTRVSWVLMVSEHWAHVLILGQISLISSQNNAIEQHASKNRVTHSYQIFMIDYKFIIIIN